MMENQLAREDFMNAQRATQATATRASGTTPRAQTKILAFCRRPPHIFGVISTVVSRGEPQAVEPAGRVAEWLKAPDSKSKSALFQLFPSNSPKWTTANLTNVYRGFLIFMVSVEWTPADAKTPNFWKRVSKCSIKKRLHLLSEIRVNFGEYQNANALCL
jgi:hypothetical protein